MAMIKELREEYRVRLQAAMDHYLYEQRAAARNGSAPLPMRAIAEAHGVTLNSMRNLRKVQLEMRRQADLFLEGQRDGNDAA